MLGSWWRRWRARPPQYSSGVTWEACWCSGPCSKKKQRTKARGSSVTTVSLSFARGPSVTTMPFSQMLMRERSGFLKPATTTENQLEAGSAGLCRVAGQHEEAAGYTCTESVRSKLVVVNATTRPSGSGLTRQIMLFLLGSPWLGLFPVGSRVSSFYLDSCLYSRNKRTFQWNFETYVKLI